MGAGSSRADAPSRRRARLGLGWCFGAGSSSAAAAAARDGGSFAADAPSSSRANEVVVPVPRRVVAWLGMPERAVVPAPFNPSLRPRISLC